MAVMWWMPSRRTSGGYPPMAGLAHDPGAALEQAEATVGADPGRVAGEDRAGHRAVQRHLLVAAVQLPGHVLRLEGPGDDDAAAVDGGDGPGRGDRRGQGVVEPLVGGQAVHLPAEGARGEDDARDGCDGGHGQ